VTSLASKLTQARPKSSASPPPTGPPRIRREQIRAQRTVGIFPGLALVSPNPNPELIRMNEQKTYRAVVDDDGSFARALSRLLRSSRDGKGSLFEGATRVCACATWPGHIKAQTVDGLIHAVDIYPTLPDSLGRPRQNANRSMDSTFGIPSARASPPRAPRSSIISSRSAPRPGKATGNPSGARCCPPAWIFITSRKTRPRRTTSPRPILKKSPVQAASGHAGSRSGQTAFPR
jgi:hypothetical protein